MDVPSSSVDYTSMWKELGLDMEAHGELVRAMPAVYHQVFMSQGFRPEGMRYFDYMVAEHHGRRVKELLDHKAAGGIVVGTFCPAVPEEIIRAFGGATVALCSGTDWVAQRAQGVDAEASCALVRSLTALQEGHVCPHVKTTDLVIGETMCATRREAFAGIKGERPLHMMHLPVVAGTEGVERWRLEVDGLVTKLEEITGRALTFDALHGAVKAVNRKRRALARFNRARAVAAPPISGRDALLAMQFAFYDDVDRYTGLIEAITDELETRIELRLGVVPSDTPRVIVTGAAMTLPDWKLHDLIESSGGVVVAEDLCTGSRYFDREIDESLTTSDALLDDIAAKHVDINCACYAATARRVDEIIRLAMTYDVSGVVHYALDQCHPYGQEAALVETELKDAGIAVLRIDTDYSQRDVEPLRQRIGEFVASLSGGLTIRQ